MRISKRNGTNEAYCPEKIKRAVSLAFLMKRQTGFLRM